MSPSRRDFLKSSAVAAAALAGPRILSASDHFGPLDAAPGALIATPTAEPFVVELAADALSAAKDAGASFADVRIGRYRRQSINTRERQITGVSDAESYGLGVRALVNGSWGFAATSTMTKDGVVKAAREAARLAKAARTVQKRPVELAPTPVVKGTWMTPVSRDPLEVPIEEKVALLFAANEAALKVPGVRFVTTGLQLLREIKTYVNTEGTETTVNDKGEKVTKPVTVKSPLTGLREPLRHDTTAVLEALRLAVANATIIGGGDSTHRMYGCLYGVEKYEDNPVAYVPGTVAAITAVQKIFSALFIFLFGLAVRNMLKMK